MRGVYILLGMIAAGVFFCGVIPFVLMPGAGVGVALPVITVPGEVLWEDFLGIDGFDMTNTIVGTLVADVLVLLFALGAVRNLNIVPSRLQGLFEVMTDALYNLAKQTAGKNARKIFPLMATLFLFLLVSNWVKLVPGAESVGLMHCAHDGVNGYEKNGITLKVDKPLATGVRATEENYDLCHHGGAHLDAVQEAAQLALTTGTARALDVDEFTYKGELENEQSLAEYMAGQEEASLDVVLEYAMPIFMRELELAELDDEDAHGETDAHAEGEGEVEPVTVAYALEHPEAVLMAAAEAPYYRDDVYAVTPFVRGATTDLNLTLGLGLLAFVAIQYFGVSALGIGYFSKFINIPALENIGKRPMGLMDFVVGLLEIISEVAKILSFGFRLFGNLFAGGVLLFVMSFLVSMLVPAAVYVLELFVGLIQAFVFAMLLLVFSSIAMEGHGHGEEEGHH